MQHVFDLAALQLETPSVLTIGVFDGAHRGHRHLIETLVRQAHEKDRLAVVMSFHPHPDIVLRGITERYYLTTVDERADIMASLGVDVMITHPFNRDVMKIRAADFVHRLVKHLNLKSLWVGKDFALGYQREGDVAFLSARGEEQGFRVEAIDLVDTADDVVSSTTIRAMLREGRVDEAQVLLGRAYSVTGEVVHGLKRGRKLGFPTANIEVPPMKLIPANGVYAGFATLGERQYLAATNVGVSPTFANKEVTVEAFLLDFDADLYGETLTFAFEKYLRPEQKFDGLDALVEQMGRDVQTTRDLLSANLLE